MSTATGRVPLLDPDTDRFPDKYTPQGALDAVQEAGLARDGAVTARGRAEDAQSAAEQAQAGAQLAAGSISKGQPNGVGSLGSDGKQPESQVTTRLSTQAESTSSSTGFLRFAGTVPGSVPVVKPAGDARAGVWEMTHNSDTGYLFHLLAGSAMSHTAALMGLGVDNDGIGLIIPNKLKGRGIVGDQRATVTATDAYWLHATQRSAAAPLVRLEQQGASVAPLLQLLSFTGFSGRLLDVVNADGAVGNIQGDTGILSWQRNVQIVNQASGEVPSYLVASTSGSANDANTRKAYHGASDDTFFGASGASGNYIPFRMAHSGSSFAVQTAPNVTGKGTNPVPADVATWTSQLSISHTGGVVATQQFRTSTGSTVGFFGATAIAKPTGVAVTIAAVHAALVSLGLIGA